MEFDNTCVRRQDRLLDETRALQLLTQGEYGFLALAGDEAQGGYGVPVSYVYDNGVIWFHCAPEGEKLRRINACPKASFCVVGNTEVQPGKFTTLYESVMAFGEIRIIGDEDLKRYALLLLLRKYSSDYLDLGTKYLEKSLHRTAILRMDIVRVSGKAKKIALPPK